MKKSVCLFLLMGLGCDVVIGTGGSDELVEQTAKECSATILGTSPYPQAIDMYYRNPIIVSLSEEDSSASVQVFDESGLAVDGSQRWEGNDLIFTPSEPLLPSQSYAASIEYCGSQQPVDIDFRTSWLGESLTGGNDSLIGKTFSVDLSSGNVVYPTGVGDLLKNLLQNTFLIQSKLLDPRPLGPQDPWEPGAASRFCLWPESSQISHQIPCNLTKSSN